ncbi:MAG TPA: MBL fold metallo-hydrolase [Methanothrix sp.]|nr:MBL fold metallo-hydrolase [Methanothrix sp.]
MNEDQIKEMPDLTHIKRQSSIPAVFLLKPGSILRNDRGRILDARSSVTLIASGKHRIVVDTGLSGEEELIVKALAETGLFVQDIDIIVNTHSHLDHCGANHLFTSARKAEGVGGETIAPGVSILATPGHSGDSISVIVRGRLERPDGIGNGASVIVIAGDALPTLNNFLKAVPPALHSDRDLAVASMKKIIEMADIVVPGHDRPFSLKKRAYIPNSGKFDPFC